MYIYKNSEKFIFEIAKKFPLKKWLYNSYYPKKYLFDPTKFFDW